MQMRVLLQSMLFFSEFVARSDRMCLQSRARSMESHEPLTQSRAENKEQRSSSSTKFNRASSLSTTGTQESTRLSCSYRAG